MACGSEGGENRKLFRRVFSLKPVVIYMYILPFFVLIIVQHVFFFSAQLTASFIQI